MDSSQIAAFTQKWARYFPQADLPIAVQYTDDEPVAEAQQPHGGDRCLIGNVIKVLEGHPFVYEKTTPGCPGGKRFAGFTQKVRPDFPEFLSCGIPGKLEGERYKQSPELVQRFFQHQPPVEAPGRYLVFKRWDQLSEHDQPQIILFFAAPDVLSGLFTLANFDCESTDGVICPMGAGCTTILRYPWLEAASKTPRCVLGMFDVSARPSVPPNTLSFAIPFERFQTMVGYMDESFLMTPSWKEVTSRWPNMQRWG